MTERMAAKLRVCNNPTCPNTFYTTGKQIYCSVTCRKRAKNQRYYRRNEQAIRERVLRNQRIAKS